MPDPRHDHTLQLVKKTLLKHRVKDSIFCFLQALPQSRVTTSIIVKGPFKSGPARAPKKRLASQGHDSDILFAPFWWVAAEKKKHLQRPPLIAAD